jgi:hypothetical protein
MRRLKFGKIILAITSFVRTLAGNSSVCNFFKLSIPGSASSASGDAN